jgi:hypothetical protein
VLFLDGAQTRQFLGCIAQSRYANCYHASLHCVSTGHPSFEVGSAQSKYFGVGHRKHIGGTYVAVKQRHLAQYITVVITLWRLSVSMRT